MNRNRRGKLERYHRTFREQFLNELDMNKITDLGDLNARLWAWVEQIYHTRPHGGLEDKKTPTQRWRDDLIQVRQLQPYMAHRIDALFYHRYIRKVRKNGTISWDGLSFEVHHQLVGEKVELVVNPHTQTAVCLKSLFGDDLGPVVPLDLNTNLHRQRQRPEPSKDNPSEKQDEHAVEIAYREFVEGYQLLVFRRKVLGSLFMKTGAESQL